MWIINTQTSVSYRTIVSKTNWWRTWCHWGGKIIQSIQWIQQSLTRENWFRSGKSQGTPPSVRNTVSNVVAPSLYDNKKIVFVEPPTSEKTIYVISSNRESKWWAFLLQKNKLLCWITCWITSWIKCWLSLQSSPIMIIQLHTLYTFLDKQWGIRIYLPLFLSYWPKNTNESYLLAYCLNS